MKPAKFKMTELGPIPSDWEVKTIEDFYEVGSSKRVFQSQWRTSGIPFYRARDIVGFRNGEKAVGGLYIDESLYETYKHSYGIPAPGDLLVTAVGTLGKVFRVVDKAPFYFKDGNIIWFRANGQYDSCLLEQLFESGWLDSQIYDTAGGSTVGTYTITNAKKTLLPSPPLPEQHRIAAALSDMDELIGALGKLVEKKRAIKTGAMQRLLTGKRRLPGFGGTEFKQTELGPIPSDWEVKDFDKAFLHISSKPYQLKSTEYEYSGRYPVVDQGQVEVVGYSNDESHLFHVPPSGVIIFGDHTRIIKYRDSDFIVGADGTQLLVGQDDCTRFLAYWLQSLDIPNLGYSRHFKFLKEGLYALPPLPEQRAIAAVLSDMDAEIAALEAEQAKYARIKSGMMQQLLTGKTRLR